MGRLYVIQPREKGRRWYCGPAAVGALTGRPFEEVRAAFNAVRGRCPTRAVMGSNFFEVEGALHILSKYRLRLSRTHLDRPRPTLAQWRRTHQAKGEVYLMCAGRHWFIIRNRMLIDNRHKDGVHVVDSGYARKRVVSYARVIYPPKEKAL